ncbi:hypothetical protein [Allorhodopirellula solitaria]|uniref:Uncharacterized protein n=1 Tax=Allorhodopirellula solitaria TaxID=2527987 RepID=A0A5C5XUV7_9BACT|nr:hypothetical protein [Allorhodopirellula solitaria]TWT66650.1 hypothetical protein CA85_27470 [Allorhodopirellula solitaria]
MNSTATLAPLVLAFMLNVNLLADAPAVPESAAQAGDVDAIFEAGSIALLNQDYAKAFHWLSKGAQAQHDY